MVAAIVVFIVLLLVLVLVHEFGHFITAKWAGCKVEEFGFGFPPRLFSIQRGETTYSFNALPIGGFVRIEGENSEEETINSPTSFSSKSGLWRVVILSAGVIMNVLLAWALLSIQAGVGVPTLVTEQNNTTLKDFKTYIVDVAPNSPAAEGGIKSLDRIVMVAGMQNPSLTQVQQLVKQHAGEKITIEVDRNGQHVQLNLTPRVNPPPHEGALGVSLAETGLQKVVWWQTPWAGLTRTWDMLSSIVSQFYYVIKQLVVAHQPVAGTLTGPIGIAVYTNEATKLGFSYILEFGALISLNLALVNILPFPALDGGRILFVLIEKIRGQRIPARYEQWTHAVGFALLIGIMLLITLKDIRHYF